uniref:Secreted protein n=1 Tax=Streptomyces avermitilis TaxID=33903 RepID=A0A499V9Y8_STRAX|nr:hypothetical protein SAVMC3_37430 [Streptomyces avermitilis]
MDYRHTMKGRRALSAVAITAGLLLTVAGCGGGDDGKSDKGTPSSTAPAKSGDDGSKAQSKAPSRTRCLPRSKARAV